MIKALFAESESGADDLREWWLGGVDEISVIAHGDAESWHDQWFRDHPDGVSVYTPGSGSVEDGPVVFTATGFLKGDPIPIMVRIADSLLYMVWLLNDKGDTVDTLYRNDSV